MDFRPRFTIPLLPQRFTTQREAVLSAFADFFGLRPVLTAWGLKTVWFAFLLSQVWQLFNLIYGTLQAGGARTPGFWLSVSPLLVSIVMNVVLVRIALEVGLRLLISPTARG